jgi:hypothetical protein
MGEAKDAKTQALKMGVPSAVALKSRAVTVMPEAVGLDDQAAIAPEEVDLEPIDPGVHLRRWKAVPATEAPKEALQFAAGEVFVRSELARRNQAQVQSSADRATVDGLGNSAMEILQRARGLRHHDVVTACGNTGNEGVGSVDPDAGTLLASAVAWGRDVDRPGMRLKDSPEGRSAAVADDRTLTERQHSGHAPAFEGDPGVADGVDPAMKAVKAPSLRAFGHGCSAEPSRPELSRADHAVLVRSDLGD